LFISQAINILIKDKIMKTKIQGKLMSIFLLLFFVMPTGSIPVHKHENGSGRKDGISSKSI
jgi:hypothetical protein